MDKRERAPRAHRSVVQAIRPTSLKSCRKPFPVVALSPASPARRLVY